MQLTDTRLAALSVLAEQAECVHDADDQEASSISHGSTNRAGTYQLQHRGRCRPGGLLHPGLHTWPWPWRPLSSSLVVPGAIQASVVETDEQ